jgi:hypothetical protein
MTETEAVEQEVLPFEPPGLRELLEPPGLRELLNEQAEELRPGQRWRPSEGPPVPRRYDWAQIKARYVEGVPDGNGSMLWPSLSEVADHFAVVLARVKEKSSKEGWVAQRTAYKNQLELTRQQQARVARLTREGAIVDDRALDAAKLGLRLCLVALTETRQAAQQRRSENVGTGLGSGIAAVELQRLASAVDAFHKIGLRATGAGEEVARLEIAGAGRAPIEISTELGRDDPGRLAGVLAVLSEAGLGDLFGGADGTDRALKARRGADGVYTTEPADCGRAGPPRGGRLERR